MAFGEPEELKAYRTLVSAFEKQNKDIDVKLIEASDRSDLLARLSTSFAGGTPPDLFLLNYRFYAQFAARGVLEPVQARMNASKLFDRSDFYKQPLDAFTYRGAAHVPAAEHLEPRRLLQQEAVRTRRGSRSRRPAGRGSR